MFSVFAWICTISRLRTSSERVRINRSAPHDVVRLSLADRRTSRKLIRRAGPYRPSYITRGLMVYAATTCVAAGVAFQWDRSDEPAQDDERGDELPS